MFFDECDHTCIDLSSHILVVGLGGCGGNVLRHLHEKGFSFDTLYISADHQALTYTKIKNKLLIGPNLRNGLGALGNMELGRACARESSDEIEKALSSLNKAVIIVVAGLGGGTGAGALPEVMRLAQKNSRLTIPIVTSPFRWEGPKKYMSAEKFIEEHKAKYGCLLHMNNSYLPGTEQSLAHAFSNSDEAVSRLVESITHPLEMPGLVNLDYNDLYAIFQDIGVPWIAMGEAYGPGCVIKSLEHAFENPRNEMLLDRPGKVFMHAAVPDGDSIDMNIVEELCSLVEERCRCHNIMYSITYDDRLRDAARLTLIGQGKEPEVPIVD